ncbi:hypothetical protein [Bradyrhizobium sp. 199]|uniref:hypothetical protein n=1 Tax=Bradyrhizobium sp. 199 TaxID=2782664 RepID=UPI001FF8CBC9|nr:hypothetical protein [Bradyrhizobium sp. 199]MCK1358825.1 hypothetical protein [Bradyrhizobium sp. 199]
MKQIILASACIMALATGGAVAQTQPAPGASDQSDVGPSSRGPATKGMTTGRSSNMQNEASDSKGAQPSAGGTNTNNMGSQAGGASGGGAGSGSGAGSGK